MSVMSAPSETIIDVSVRSVRSARSARSARTADGADSADSAILREEQRLVHHIGMIYLNREDQDVVDVNLERWTTSYAHHIDDLDRRETISISPRHFDSESLVKGANICRELAILYRPRNLNLILCIDSSDQTNMLYQNYGDCNVIVIKFTGEPLVLDDMDVRQYLDYDIQGKISLTMFSVINLLRRCRGPVTFVHKGFENSFDQPIATIVPPLKKLLSFLWQEASSSDRGRFDLTFTIPLNREQKQQLHQHCIDISPGETQSEVEFSSAKLPGPDESTVVYIHMETTYQCLTVYTRRLLTGRDAPIPLEPRPTPWLTSMASVN